MSIAIETHRSNGAINSSSVTYPFDAFVEIITGNFLIALQWETILIRAIFDLNNATGILSSLCGETFTQLKRPEDIVNEEPWERIDVKNGGLVRTAERTGRKDKKKTKKDKKKEKLEKERRERRERNRKRAEEEREEQERLRRWEESWEKKLRAQEERDRVECCVGQGLCLKPRTQSNIWINVTKDRSIQEIHMTFKHVPVPRPKPPPLPPRSFRRPVEPNNDVPVENNNNNNNNKGSKKNDASNGKKK